MFLTTESILSGKTYVPIRVISAVAADSLGEFRRNAKITNKWNAVIREALGTLEHEAIQLGAHGVIGVHLNTLQMGGDITAIVMGTAIKF